jgi:hypothetical protein
MKTLKNHVILYDAECPMCNLYTHAFTATGMLDEKGRAPYQEVLAAKAQVGAPETTPLWDPTGACPLIDRQRAVNEIALVNTLTGEVQYGIESLFAVIANAFPFFRPLFSCRPFVRVMRRVYAFISYNRKVIIPPPRRTTGEARTGNHRIAGEAALAPSFSLRYRVAYLLFTWLVVGGILTAYAPLLKGMVPLGNAYREYLICGGQIFFQGLVLALYAPARRWDYLGNMMTISLGGALLLTPALLAAKFFHLSALLFTLYFLAVAGLMFLEHMRRSRLLGLGWLPTASWTLYRLALLGLILVI